MAPVHFHGRRVSMPSGSSLEATGDVRLTAAPLESVFQREVTGSRALLLPRPLLHSTPAPPSFCRSGDSPTGHLGSPPASSRPCCLSAIATRALSSPSARPLVGFEGWCRRASRAWLTAPHRKHRVYFRSEPGVLPLRTAAPHSYNGYPLRESERRPDSPERLTRMANAYP